MDSGKIGVRHVKHVKHGNVIANEKADIDERQAEI